jgi:hypothetical protein
MPAWPTTPAYLRSPRPSATALSTYAMPAQYNGIAFRFRAPGTGDVKGVRVRWGTVTAAGTVTVRIETIDATTGKPTGTLYDANATITATPVAGNQLFTFAVLPTTGLVAGTEYAVVVQTATAGTAHTITGYSLGALDGQASGNFPAAALTNADVRTPANWAEVASATPACGIVLEDDSEPNVAWVNCPSNVQVVIWGTIGSGAKLTLSARILASGLVLCAIRTGTPAGDLRGRILDSSGTLVAGATVTLDKDSLTSASTKNVMAHFAAAVALPAGTYTILWDSPNSVSGSNCWTLTYGVAWSTACRSDNMIRRTTADTTASPIVWDDTNTTHVFIGGLVLSDIPAPTFPAEANTWFGSGQYGPAGTDYTPGKRASSIANCTPGNVKKDVPIDDVTGTYDPPNIVLPDPASPILTSALDAIRTMLSNLASVQTFLGVATAAEALERIHRDPLLGPETVEAEAAWWQALRPFIVICADVGSGRIAGRSAMGFGSGRAAIFLQQNYPADQTAEAAERDWRTTADQILGDLMNLQDLLLLQAGTIEDVGTGDPTENSALGEFQVARLAIEWGWEA